MFPTTAKRRPSGSVVSHLQSSFFFFFLLLSSELQDISYCYLGFFSRCLARPTHGSPFSSHSCLAAWLLSSISFHDVPSYLGFCVGSLLSSYGFLLGPCLGSLTSISFSIHMAFCRRDTGSSLLVLPQSLWERPGADMNPKGPERQKEQAISKAPSYSL